MRRNRLLPVIVGLAIVSMIPAYGQSKGQTPAPAPTPSPSPGGGTRTPTPTPTPTPQPGREQQRIGIPEQQRENPFENQPVFLSGKVLLDDGTPPSESVVIELVCGGQHRPQAYTDSKGRFSFEVGKNNNVMPDASVSGGLDQGFGGMGRSSRNARPNLMGCELRAALPGFRSENVNLTNRRGLDNPDVGTIVLHRLANVEGTTISATTLNAPKDARKAFEKGTDALRKEKWDDARKHLTKAVETYPQFAAAWCELGRVHEQDKNVEEARKAYAQALNADAKYTKPLAQLSLLAAREQKWQEVAETTDKLIKLDRFSYPEAFYYNSLANFQLRNLDAAEKSAREIVKLDTEHRLPKANHLLGVILANKGEYSEAAQSMRNYLAFAPKAGDTALVQKQLTEIEQRMGPAARAPEPQK